MTLKSYWIEVRGFDGYRITAETPGKARYASFSAYDDVGYGHGRGRDYAPRRERFRRFLGRIETFHHLGPAK